MTHTPQRTNHQNIYLTGFMGAGKTAVGNLLAKKLRRSFVDCDTLIETQHHSTITEIFQNQGELHFRTLESQALQELSQKNSLVVSCGGGIVLEDKNRELLKQGRWFFLNPTLDTLMQRALHSPQRPLAQNKEDFTKRYQQRLPLYQQAPHHIDSTHLTVEETCQMILKALTSP